MNLEAETKKELLKIENSGKQCLMSNVFTKSYHRWNGIDIKKKQDKKTTKHVDANTGVVSNVYNLRQDLFAKQYDRKYHINCTRAETNLNLPLL